MPVLSKKSAWIIAHMKQTYNFIPHLKSQNIYFHNSLNQAAIEEYFIFFTHICAPQIIPKEVKIVLGETFLNATTFSRILSFKVIDHFQLDYEEEKNIYLHIT